MDRKLETKKGAVMALLVSTVIWGVSFSVIKVAVADVDPFFLITLRFLIAALIVLGIVLALRRPIKKLLNNKILWILGVTNAVGFAMEFYGLTLTTATKASLLVNINVVFMAIFAAAMLNEKVSSRAKLGILVGILGVFLTTTGGDMSTLLSGSSLGDLIIFAGGIVWAYSNIYNKRAATELGLSAMEVTESMTLITAIALLPLLPFSSFAFPISVFSVSALLYLSVACTILGFLLFYMALKTLSVVNSGVVLLFEIVVAIIVASIFLGESITPVGAIGGVLIGASILLVS